MNLRFTSIETAILKLDPVFTTHGFANEVMTDNSHSCNIQDFNRWMSLLGIKLNSSTPLLPLGNSEIERFIQTHGITIRAVSIKL